MHSTITGRGSDVVTGPFWCTSLDAEIPPSYDMYLILIHQHVGSCSCLAVVADAAG